MRNFYLVVQLLILQTSTVASLQSCFGHIHSLFSLFIIPCMCKPLQYYNGSSSFIVIFISTVVSKSNNRMVNIIGNNEMFVVFKISYMNTSEN